MPKPDPSEKSPLEKHTPPVNKEEVEEISLEDRLLLFWHNYRNWIIGGVSAVILVFLAVQVARLIEDRRETGRRAAYAAIETRQDRLAFAERHARSPLGGVAYLELADESYEEERYAEAAGFYERSQRGLGRDNALSGRARLGYGVSLILSDRSDQGITALEQLARDEQVPLASRLEALYHLATVEEETGNIDRARSHLDRILDLDQNTLWSSRARERLAALEDSE